MKNIIEICYICKIGDSYKDMGCCKKCFIKRVKSGSAKKIKVLKNRSSEKKLRRMLRRNVLTVYPRQCMKCGSTRKILHVDHIKPVSKFPRLVYDYMNLQVLCINCNMIKSNKNENDYRSKRQILSMETFVRGLSYQNKIVKRYLRDNNLKVKKVSKIRPEKIKTILRKKLAGHQDCKTL